ncbi:hypothetical protein [Bradyrhizobium zhanjiangense]|uniref:Uncharacterized protein n=1 Tax=Bradyrhizobium zhanjiangense TaxID=1325107 RepID=A0A4Q0SQX3_9BRAD|nr:hypothetical protein [Bradyrhizobium zhanjiangense]RXH41058.1 hypothetical protein XH94_09450 [Bradyrhizobium zhanjiangense]
MALRIVEKNLENVQPELHGLYVKQKNGEYHLNISDLEDYFARRTADVAAELKITQLNEKRLAIEECCLRVLSGRNVMRNGEIFLRKHLEECLAIETMDGQRVGRIRGEDGKSLIGDGSDGFSTLTEAATRYVEQYPTVFGVEGGGKSSPAASLGKTITRQEFDSLDPISRAQRMRDGYTLVEGHPAALAKAAVRPGDKLLSRAEFDRLAPKERATRFAEGYKLVD